MARIQNRYFRIHLACYVIGHKWMRFDTVTYRSPEIWEEGWCHRCERWLRTGR